MTKQERLQKIENYIKKMPSLPVTVTKVREICDNPKTSPIDLYKVISLDPVLMGKVMKLINSAYYGLSGKVTSLVRAIIMLGMNTVKNLALSTTVMGIMGGTENTTLINYTQFWKHSLCTGIASKILAKKKGVDRNRQEEFFIAGMLHDIGKIPIISCFPDEYNRMITMCAGSTEKTNNSCLFREESILFEIDHSHTGGLIAELWNLDEQIKQVIVNHHLSDNLDEEFRDIVYTVAIADYFTNIIGYGFIDGCLPRQPDKTLFEKTGITMEMLDDITDIVREELEKAKVFLDYKEG